MGEGVCDGQLRQRCSSGEEAIAARAPADVAPYQATLSLGTLGGRETLTLTSMPSRTL